MKEYLLVFDAADPVIAKPWFVKVCAASVSSLLSLNTRVGTLSLTIVRKLHRAHNMLYFLRRH